MDCDARLNLLLTPSPAKAGGGPAAQPWQQTVSRLLVPLGVRTFEARSGLEAVELMERHRIHLAVVDTRLPEMGGMNVLQLMGRLREHGQQVEAGGAADGGTGGRGDGERGLGGATSVLPSLKPAGETAQRGAGEDTGVTGVGTTTSFQFQMRVEETTADGQTQRRIEVRFDARPMVRAGGAGGGPAVILIAPPPSQQDPQLLQEALKFNAFSVLNEPVDVNLALEVMARALKRFHQNHWPGT